MGASLLAVAKSMYYLFVGKKLISVVLTVSAPFWRSEMLLAIIFDGKRI